MSGKDIRFCFPFHLRVVLGEKQLVRVILQSRFLPIFLEPFGKLVVHLAHIRFIDESTLAETVVQIFVYVQSQTFETGFFKTNLGPRVIALIFGVRFDEGFPVSAVLVLLIPTFKLDLGF